MRLRQRNTTDTTTATPPAARGGHSHRAILGTVISLGAVLGVVQATGVFAASTDTATTGQNHVATGVILPAGGVDLKIAEPTGTQTCADATYADNDVFSLNVTGIVRTPAGSTIGSSKRICIKNTGAASTSFSHNYIDPVCSNNPTGACSATDNLRYALTLIFVATGGSNCPDMEQYTIGGPAGPDVGSIGAGAICTYNVVLNAGYPVAEDSSQEQYDFKIRFSASN